MATESRMTFVTSPEVEQKLKTLAGSMNLSASKTINKIIETALTINIERIWQLEQAAPVTNFSIITKIKDTVGESVTV